MKIAIMQPYIFPYLGYFQLIAAVDKFVILDDVNYINKGWINRNRILINGKPSMFTVPLDQASQNRLIKDISLSHDKRWGTKFLKSIEMAYKKTPYFADFFPLIKAGVERNVQGISDMVYYSLVDICTYLNINTEIVPHSEIYHTDGLQGQEKILKICMHSNATHYINPIGGMELYDRILFNERNIDLNFLSPHLEPYAQNSDEFVAGLSIIDVLMYNSPAQVKNYLKSYTLI
jgi:hypothetical protein